MKKYFQNIFLQWLDTTKHRGCFFDDMFDIISKGQIRIKIPRPHETARGSAISPVPY